MKDLKLSTKLLGDFSGALDKRSPYFLVYKVLPKILTWHVKIWKKDMEYLGKGNEFLDTWSNYSQLENILTSIFDLILKKVLTQVSMDYYYFFDQFTKHINTYKDEKETIQGQETPRLYSEHMLSNFYRTFLSGAADSPNSFHLWEFFPRNWVVTTSSIADSKNIIPRITLGQFLQWAGDRISSSKEKDFDKALDDASEYLFPEVDPVSWAAILNFVLSSYDPENRVGSIIKRPWVFGLGGRIRSFSGPAGDDKKFEEDMQKHMRQMDEIEKEKTFELTVALSKMVGVFYRTFAKENLEKMISETKALEKQYSADSIEEHRRKRLLEIFSGLLDFIKKREGDNKSKKT